MPSRVPRVVIMTALMLAGANARADPVARPAITVTVYDYTSLPATMLDRAERDVVRIFGAVGIEVMWTAAGAVDALPRFAIQILIRGQAARASRSRAALAMG